MRRASVRPALLNAVRVMWDGSRVFPRVRDTPAPGRAAPCPIIFAEIRNVRIFRLRPPIPHANGAPHPDRKGFKPTDAGVQSGRSSGVEHNLAKVGVEGSNPFARSIFLYITDDWNVPARARASFAGMRKGPVAPWLQAPISLAARRLSGHPGPRDGKGHRRAVSIHE